MPRDYGSRRPSRQKSGAPHQFLVVSVTFLLGYLTASVFDIETISHWMNTQVLAHQEVKQESVKPAVQNTQLPPKPKFEFYTLLANEKGAAATQNKASANAAAARASASSPASIVVATAQPKSAIKAIANSATSSAKPSSITNQQPQAVKVVEGKPLAPAQKSNSAFVVQVAAFKARQDAEHLKGLLILKGYNVSVIPVSNARGNWFRVVAGPYSNRGLAQRAQGDLAKNERLKGMVTVLGG